MYWELIVEEYQRIKRAYWITLTFLLGYILFAPNPHTNFDFLMFVFSFVHGSAIATTIFNHEKPSPFLFTLPLSRSKLFLLQFATGFILILVSLLAAFFVIALGFRCGVQLVMDSVFFPAVWQYELWTIPSIFFYSLMGYVFLTYMLIHVHFKKSFSRKRRLAKEDERAMKIIVGVLVGVSCICMLLAAFHAPPRTTLRWNSILSAIVLAIGALSVIMTIVSLYAYRHVEIDPQERSIEMYKI